MRSNQSPECPTGPFTLNPKQQPTVWGGHLLHAELGKPAADEPIGESWEVWTGNTVSSGPGQGLSLQHLTDQCQEALLGTVPFTRWGSRFPLLTKFIDAQEALSVQVHPNDAEAQRMERQANGKTEAWYIISAAPDAWVIHGLERPVDRAVFEERLRAGTADELLHRVPVETGDTVFMPAGTIHAIGPGVLLHEVQQTSDVTYRLYDWNRQAQGSKRELHLEKGLDVARLRPSRQATIAPLCWHAGLNERSVLVACDYFVIERIHLHEPHTLHIDGASFQIVTALEGAVRLHSNDNSTPLELHRGGSAVVPASAGACRLEPSPEAAVLMEYVADIEGDLIPKLRGAGIAQSDIDAFVGQFRQ